MQALQRIGFKNAKVQHNVIMIASQRKRKLLCRRINCEMVSRQNVTEGNRKMVRIWVIIGVRVDVRVLTL